MVVASEVIASEVVVPSEVVAEVSVDADAVSDVVVTKSVGVVTGRSEVASASIYDGMNLTR